MFRECSASIAVGSVGQSTDRGRANAWRSTHEPHSRGVSNMLEMIYRLGLIAMDWNAFSSALKCARVGEGETLRLHPSLCTTPSPRAPLCSSHHLCLFHDLLSFSSSSVAYHSQLYLYIQWEQSNLSRRLASHRWRTSLMLSICTRNHSYDSRQLSIHSRGVDFSPITA